MSVFAHHDQVHQGHGVEADVPQPHDAKHVDQDHCDGDADQHRWPQLEAQQDGGHHEDGSQRHAQVEGSVVGDGEVLLVEHVEHAAGDTETRLGLLVKSVQKYSDSLSTKKSFQLRLQCALLYAGVHVFEGE